MARKSLVLIILVFGLWFVYGPKLVLAESLESSVVSGGSGTMRGQNYNLFDVKATPLVGTMVGSGYTLEVGVGVFFPPEAPSTGFVTGEGPVILHIRRAADTPGSDIVITWEVNTASFPILNPNSSVDIYMLTGDGTGQYHPTSGWEKIVANNALVSGVTGFTIDSSNKTLTYQGQVGGGENEAYFKALITGSATGDATYGLPGAVAVGKVNVMIYGNRKYNMIGVPLLQSSDSIDEVLSAGLRKNGIELLKFDNNSQEYRGAYYDNGWQGKTIDLKNGDGIWVYNPLSSDLTLTIVGKVPNASIDVQVYGGGKYNMLALPHVQSGTLTMVGLDPIDESEILVFDNDKQSYSGTYVSNNAWEKNLLINPGRAFWYYNKGNNFIWQTKVR